MIAGGEVQRLPVIAAERQLVVAGAPCTMRPSFLPVRIHDPDAARAAAIDIARGIDLHAVGNAGFVAAQVGEHAVGLFRERAVGRQVEGPDMPAARIVDVEHAFVGREGETVGHDEVADQQRHGAEIGRHAIDAGERSGPTAAARAGWSTGR